MKNRWASLIVGVLFVGVVRADIAPTVYNGYTFTTRENSDIRMKSEEVDVYWGQRSETRTLVSVVARFEMVNETDKPIRMAVRFPVSTSAPEDVYDLQVWINDADSLQPVREIQREEPSRYWFSERWYGWDQTFSPGRTIVRVQYRVRTFMEDRGNGVYESLLYLLDSAASWKGTIAQADVRIHFAEPPTAEQVRELTWPRNWRIDGNDLCWRFENFKPGLKDNIVFQFMPFEVRHELDRLRKAVRQNPQDEQPVIELARRCFSLVEGGGHVVPGSFDILFSRIDDPDDRAEVRRFFQELGEEGKKPSLRIEQVLSAVILSFRWPHGYVTEAREAMDRFLGRNPKNARVWLVYLANCHRFVPNGYTQELRNRSRSLSGRDPGPVMIPAEQKEIVELAYALCPDDEGIKAWHEFVTSGDPVPPEKVGQLRERLRNSSSRP